jgi:hypothetical protein
VGTLSNWIAAIGAAFKRPTEHSSPPPSPPSHATDESDAESAAVDDAVAEDAVAEHAAAGDAAAEDAVVENAVMENAVVENNAAAAVVAEDKAVAAAVEPVQTTQAPVTSGTSPDHQEIQRRRELVRALFNDFWKGNDEKPVTFVDRLNQAETYLNERLIERGEPWQLNAATRKMLGLPPRAH